MTAKTELPDDWVRVFDDMVLVQQRTEAKRDALHAENERLQTQIADALNEIVVLNGSINWLRAEVERLNKAVDKMEAINRRQLERLEDAQTESERLQAALDDEREALCMEVERLRAQVAAHHTPGFVCQS